MAGPIDRIRTELARRIEAERSEYDRLMRSLEELCRKGALDGDSGVRPSSLSKASPTCWPANSIASACARCCTPSKPKQRLIELLNAYVDARQQTVRVVVGLEDAIPGMHNLVLIGATGAPRR